MSSICNICCEKNNKTKNKSIICPYCNFEACKKCCETFILGETVEKCMNTSCGKAWTRKFVTDNFTASFVNGPLKNHKKNLLFERERGLLPATQPIVEEEIRKERLREALDKNKQEEELRLVDLKKIHCTYLLEFRDLQFLLSKSCLITVDTKEESENKEKLQERNDFLKKELKIIRKEIMKITREHETIRMNMIIQMHPQNGLESGENTNNRHVFVRACPDEECRGFLSTQWKCGLCEKWACPDCHVVKGLTRNCDHTCNPDDVATAKLLANDTKPCPNCRTGIFKISGCDQMFCTQCHTGFSWKTGQIETRMHNPHYFEWIRRTRETGGGGGGAQAERNPLEVLCGREIDNLFINDMLHIFNHYDRRGRGKKTEGKVLNICRSLVELAEVVIPIYTVDDILNNQSLRVKYMRGKITEPIFKTQLLRHLKEHEKKKEYRDILVMFRNTVTDILYRYKDSFSVADYTNDQQLLILDEIDALIVYVNECLLSIAKAYGCTERVLKYSKGYYFLSFCINYKLNTKTPDVPVVPNASVVPIVPVVTI